LFSATVPLWVERIAAKFMHKQRCLVDLIKGAEIKTSKTVTHCSMCIKYKEIIPLMKDIVNVYCGKHGRCIIFCERKDEVNEILHEASLNIEAEALHSDIPQSQREITFKKFKEGKLKCLISTNVAARGLDIPHVDLVIQL
jgi:ATP-dependent RNA helicase DDX21